MSHLTPPASFLVLLALLAAITIPAAAEEPHDTLCAGEDDGTPIDGSCENGIYRNPTAQELNDHQIAKRNELMCGPDGLEDDTTVLDGSCRYDGNWVLTTNVSAILVELDERLSSEPDDSLCAAEDDGTTLDGACDDGTYRNPHAGDVLAAWTAIRDATFCGPDGIEDNQSAIDGQCDERGHWSVPQNAPAVVQELLAYLP